MTSFEKWYATRYGVFPTPKDQWVFFGLWKWSVEQRKKEYNGIRHPIVNPHIARKMAEQLS